LLLIELNICARQLGGIC